MLFSERPVTEWIQCEEKYSPCCLWWWPLLPELGWLQGALGRRPLEQLLLLPACPRYVAVGTWWRPLGLVRGSPPDRLGGTRSSQWWSSAIRAAEICRLVPTCLGEAMGRVQSWVVMMIPWWDGAEWDLLFSSIGLVNIKLKLLDLLPRRRLTCFPVLEITKFGVLLAQWHVHTARSEGNSRRASSLTINCEDSNKIHFNAKKPHSWWFFSKVFLYLFWLIKLRFGGGRRKWVAELQTQMKIQTRPSLTGR